MATDYKTVRVSATHVKEIMDFLEKNTALGYRSHSEFIIDALRQNIERYISLKKDGKVLSHGSANGMKLTGNVKMVRIPTNVLESVTMIVNETQHLGFQNPPEFIAHVISRRLKEVRALFRAR